MKEKHYPNEWPPERVSALRQLFDEGVCFEQIAGQLAMTRSAIIGKCHRLGLRRDPPPSLHEKRSAAAKVGNLTRKLRPGKDPARNIALQKIVAGPRYSDEPLPSTHESDLAIPRRRRRNVFTLGPRDCKFPVGDPGTSSFFFCGARKLPTLPYCAEHARRCFTPARS